MIPMCFNDVFFATASIVMCAVAFIVGLERFKNENRK